MRVAVSVAIWKWHLSLQKNLEEEQPQEGEGESPGRSQNDTLKELEEQESCQNMRRVKLLDD